MFAKGISQPTRKSLALLGQTNLTDQFYLAGGTACTLWLGHRLSFDLDFFTVNKFNSKDLSKQIAKLGSFTADRVADDTLLGTFLATKVSFFYYQYPLIEKPETFDGVSIAVLADIAAMKIDAIGSRGVKRDFIDLYFIAQEHPLRGILNFYDQKYGLLNTNRLHILKSLIYFADAQKDVMPIMLKKVSWHEVEVFFEREVKNIAKASF